MIWVMGIILVLLVLGVLGALLGGGPEAEDEEKAAIVTMFMGD